MTEGIKEFVAWMGIIGIPSIFAMTSFCIGSCVRFSRKLKVFMESQQAQMRNEMLNQYKNYIKQGWIDIEDLENWENQYQKYHLLGANGVMDGKRSQLIALPNIPPTTGN